MSRNAVSCVGHYVILSLLFHHVNRLTCYHGFCLVMQKVVFVISPMFMHLLESTLKTQSIVLVWEFAIYHLYSEKRINVLVGQGSVSDLVSKLK